MKELKQEIAWFTIGLPGLVGFEFILLSFSGRWPAGCLVIGGVSLFGIFLCVLHNIVRSHTTEWAKNTSQFLFSLPIRGWHIVWAKFCVQSIVLIVFSLIAFFVLYFIARIRIGHTVGITLVEVIRFWLIYLWFILPGLSFILFPYVVAKCFVRFQKVIIGFLEFGIILGFLKYLLQWGTKLFSFLPEATITLLSEEGTGSKAANLFPGLAFYALFGIVLLWASSLILDRWTQT